MTGLSWVSIFIFTYLRYDISILFLGPDQFEDAHSLVGVFLSKENKISHAGKCVQCCQDVPVHVKSHNMYHYENMPIQI